MAINVLSICDGMSCGMIALDRDGIKVDRYYASEIDAPAITVSRANYPDIERLGDMENWANWDIEWSKIDLVLSGTPCQGFSFAGKGLAFDDPRSKLFFTFCDILEHVKSKNPNVKFLFENVQMKAVHRDVITKYLSVEPVLINSALVSAQNRKRLYWCNWSVSQPADRKIMLADIIENGCTDRLKSYNLSSSYANGASIRDYFTRHKRQLIFFAGRGKNPAGFRALNGKCPSLTSNSFEQNNFLAGVFGYRKLTPLECERLQTVPAGYTAHVSNTQRYKMLGNSWTVDAIAHIFGCCAQLDDESGD